MKHPSKSHSYEIQVSFANLIKMHAYYFNLHKTRWHAFALISPQKKSVPLFKKTKGENMAKKVALYCRVSTGNQSTGLEAQVRALRDYCSRNAVSDYVIYEDENQSGLKQSRPALDRMMKDVRDGQIGKVIVYSFSRYARSVTHLLRALEEFKKLDVGFVSVTESIDTNTPLGSAVFTILGTVAQLERDLIAERVRNRLANAKAKGIRIGRLKARDSDLIRKLKASGMTYRQIAYIARCSAGAVGAEMRALKKERAEEEKIKQILEEATAKISLDTNFIPSPLPSDEFKDMILIFQILCRNLKLNWKDSSNDQGIVLKNYALVL